MKEKKKIAVYLDSNQYDKLQESVLNANKTITAYCTEKIFMNQTTNEDYLKKHILRQFEDLLFLLISQKDIDTSKINQESLKKISSFAIHIGNLKAKNNKELKIQREIEKSYEELFKYVNIKTINRLILDVNKLKDSNKKTFLLASYINKIRDRLKE
jgi:hypothetical protein